MTEAHEVSTTAGEPAYRTHDVAVDGGTLRVGDWGAEGDDVVVSAHGITGSHRCWVPLARALAGRRRLVAPDLRGRARSAGVAAPYGMIAHADDLVATLDALDVERADVVGHSMGGFVAAVFAARHPERVRRLVLVDGGLPLPVQEPFDVDATLQAVIGPAFARLDMRFESREAYHELWRAHPAFARDWGPDVEQYVDYDLAGDPPQLRASASKDAVRADATDQLTGDVLVRSVESLTRPFAFLAADRGLLDDDRQLYPDELITPWRGRLPAMSVERVPGVNHYTVVLSGRGAEAIAAALTR